MTITLGFPLLILPDHILILATHHSLKPPMCLLRPFNNVLSGPILSGSKGSDGPFIVGLSEGTKKAGKCYGKGRQTPDRHRSAS
jgi:hypothetical protein